MSTVETSCHCGAVVLRIELPNGIVDPHRCDCSFCKRRAAPNVSVPLEALKILKGGDKLSLYTFGTGTAKHYFCSVCGIYTHHQRRSNPNEYGVNLGTIDGINPADHEPMPWLDGQSHPSDR